MGTLLAILFTLKSMEMLGNGLQSHSRASSLNCHGVDADTWCKRALTIYINPQSIQSLEQCLLRNDHRGPRLAKYDQPCFLLLECAGHCLSGGGGVTSTPRSLICKVSPEGRGYTPQFPDQGEGHFHAKVIAYYIIPCSLGAALVT